MGLSNDLRNPFHAQSMAPYLRERVGLMAMCLLVTVVRLLSRGTASEIGGTAFCVNCGEMCV